MSQQPRHDQDTKDHPDSPPKDPRSQNDLDEAKRQDQPEKLHGDPVRPSGSAKKDK
jgi:hypothetical protein